MDSKPFWHSIGFWFNILSVLVTVASAFGFADFKPSGEAQQVGLLLVIAINLGLSFVRKQRLAVNAPADTGTRSLFPVKRVADWW